ncbi:HNH endonuclease signature motif containing protein [Fimbriiglobus ruber]|uniref:HNH endonuclease signature motif containing protein n=1 Tax=Fimbriiglobus ruber TaxID=1908690 RepID=UPI000B4B31E2
MEGQVEPSETLRPISWAPNYAVSDRGNVYRVTVRDGVTTYRKRKPYLGKVGYYVVTIQGDQGKAPPRYIHRLVAEAFLPPCPANHEVRHLDGTRTNNCIENLAWGTRLENVQDTRRHGRLLRGEDITGSKLSETDVRVIRYLLSRGASIYSISSVFKISDAAIKSVQTGRTWSHIEESGREVFRAEDKCDTEYSGSQGVLCPE